MTIAPAVTDGHGAESSQPIRFVEFVRFFLRFIEPGGVTVPGYPDRDESGSWGRERAHLLLDSDPWGRPHLPGTSVAGALREMVRAADGPQTADLWFGHLLPAGSGDPAEVDARASQLWVLGTRPVGADDGDLSAVPSQIRASTAISRFRAAAEANTLRVEEMLPVGTRFEVFLRWDNPPAQELGRLLDLLAGWRPVIGRGTSRGRGRCAAEDMRHGSLQLGDPRDLHQWLTSSGPELARTVATKPGPHREPGTSPDVLMRVTTRITGPLRVGSGEPPERSGSQGQLVAPMLREGDSYIVPGTGLKGLLRSRAEYILRSVGVTPSPCTDQRCGACWTCQVFGHAGAQDSASLAVGQRAIIRVPDNRIEDPVPVRRQHVAIDRFTGGARDGLLYTVDALEGGCFTITVEPLALDGGARLAEIRAVLRLVMEDLRDGITGVGAGVARGYGTVIPDLEEAVRRGELPGAEAARKELTCMVAAESLAGRDE